MSLFGGDDRDGPMEAKAGTVGALDRSKSPDDYSGQIRVEKAAEWLSEVARSWKGVPGWNKSSGYPSNDGRG
jgi:hypothetical protein